MPVQVIDMSFTAEGELGVSLAIDVAPLSGPHCINVDVFRVGKLREELIFGIGKDLGASGEPFTFSISSPLNDGLYLIPSVRAIEQLPPPPDWEPQQGPPPPSMGEQHQLLDPSAEFGGALPFKVEDGLVSFDQAVLIAELRNAYAAREALITTPMRTTAGTLLTGPVFTVVIFCMGALIHNRQHLEGLSIVPYGNGLSCEAIAGAVNEFIFPHFQQQLTDLSNAQATYSQQTPLFAVVYHKVIGTTREDAEQFCQMHTTDLCTILSVERGARPSPFASFVSGEGSGTVRLFFEGYRGNLLAPMSPGEHAERIERDLPRLFRSRRARLLMETLAQAISERDLPFAYFRYWAALELVAKGSILQDDLPIFDAHGAQITGQNGAPVFTKGAASKVYKYLFDAGMGGANHSFSSGDLHQAISIEAHIPSVQPGATILPMWNVVGALIEIRNSVAHTGSFIPDPLAPAGSRKALAAEFYEHPTNLLFSFLRSMAEIAVLREIAKE